MRNLRLPFALVLASVCAVALALAAAAEGATTASRTVLQSSAPAATPASQVSATPASTPIESSVGLQLSDPAGALASSAPSRNRGARATTTTSRRSSGRSASPTPSSVAAVTAWLRAEGVAVEGVTPDRLIEASASAETIERAFATSLGEYRHARQVVRLAAGPLQVPSGLAPLIAGVTGVDQNLATPTSVGADTRRAAKVAGKEIPQPPGFRNAPPCSSYYGRKKDTTDPAYGGGYPEPLPYAVCGYVPSQLQVQARDVRLRCTRGINQGRVTCIQVGEVGDLISPERAAAAAMFGPAHHPGFEEGAVDDQLTPALEQVEQARRARRPLERVGSLNRHPWHPPAFGG